MINLFKKWKEKRDLNKKLAATERELLDVYKRYKYVIDEALAILNQHGKSQSRRVNQTVQYLQNNQLKMK